MTIVSVFRSLRNAGRVPPMCRVLDQPKSDAKHPVLAGTSSRVLEHRQSIRHRYSPRETETYSRRSTSWSSRQMRELDFARRAPGSPKIDQRHPACQRFFSNRSAISSEWLQVQIEQRLANGRCCVPCCGRDPAPPQPMTKLLTNNSNTCNTPKLLNWELLFMGNLLSKL